MRQKKNNSADSSRAGRTAFELIMCVVGTFLYSAGVALFVIPMKFAAGGVTGVGIIINYLFPVIPTGAVVFILNIPLFVLAWKTLGCKFIARTFLATACLSMFIDLLTKFGGEYGWFYSGDERLLAAIFGGITAGAGLGIVFLNGATTGGFDIIARLLRIKFPHISVGKLIMLCDFAVVLLTALVYRSAESLLYSAVMIFLSSQAIDYIIAGKSRSKLMFIMTSAPDKVCGDIISVCGRGVSLIHSAGGYTKKEKETLMCVVRINEVSAVRKIVEKYDDSPFIIIADSSEVLGKGFKSYQETL